MCMCVLVLVNASRLGISSIKLKHLCPCWPRLLAALMRTMATVEMYIARDNDGLVVMIVMMLSVVVMMAAVVVMMMSMVVMTIVRVMSVVVTIVMMMTTSSCELPCCGKAV